jgi:nitrogen-specific signal transduction histidine kinase
MKVLTGPMEYLFEAFFNDNNDGICLIDSRLKIIHANAILRKWFPEIEKDSGNKGCGHLYHCDNRCDACFITKALTLGKWQHQVVDAKQLNSEKKKMTIYAAPLPGTGEPAEMALIHLKYISEPDHHNSKRKTVRTKETTSATDDSIMSLAGGVAHQFNNALAAININVELLERKCDNPKQMIKHLNRIKESTYRMTLLTEKLVACAGGGKYQAKAADMKLLIQRVISQVKSKMEPNVELVMRPPREQLMVHVDETQIHRVLEALISNAVEALEEKTSGGQIFIQCEHHHSPPIIENQTSEMESGPFIGVAIKDNGIGMDDDIRCRIFEPFFSTKFYGRGMDMAAAYGIVSNHGGFMQVDSKRGEGTCVTIYLPLLQESERWAPASKG